MKKRKEGKKLSLARCTLDMWGNWRKTTTRRHERHSVEKKEKTKIVLREKCWNVGNIFIPHASCFFFLRWYTLPVALLNFFSVRKSGTQAAVSYSWSNFTCALARGNPKLSNLSHLAIVARFGTRRKEGKIVYGVEKALSTRGDNFTFSLFISSPSYTTRYDFLRSNASSQM